MEILNKNEMPFAGYESVVAAAVAVEAVEEGKPYNLGVIEVASQTADASEASPENKPDGPKLN